MAPLTVHPYEAASY